MYTLHDLGDPQGVINPKEPKGKIKTLSIPVEKDRNEILRRSKNTYTDNRFCFPKNEKKHYNIYEGVPVFNVFNNNKESGKFDSKRKGLQTLNGLMFNPNLINNEKDLLKYIKFFGFAHTEKVEHSKSKYILNENLMFDAIYFGEIPLTALTFTDVIRNEKGLIHEKSCQRINPQINELYTISFFPFDFKTSDYLSKEDPTAKNSMKANGWLVDEDLYNPKTEKWYNFWYGGIGGIKGRAGFPKQISENERIVPIYRRISHIHHKNEEEMVKQAVKLYEKHLPDLDKEPSMKKVIDFIRDSLYYNSDRFTHFKVFGDTKENFTVKFGGSMQVKICMDRTT
jgi:hypothetical protein